MDWRFGELADGMFVGYDRARAGVRLFRPFPEERYEQDGSLHVATWAEAEQGVENLLGRLEEAGLPGKEYWSVEKPLLTMVHERLEDNSVRVWGYVYTIFRQVNGSPIRAIPLTVMIHRSGEVVYLALSGRRTDTSGPAGQEGNEVPKQYLLVSLADAINHFKEKRIQRTGRAPHVFSVDLRYESKGKSSIDECDEETTCIRIGNMYAIKFVDSAVKGQAQAPPVRHAYVDAVSGDVFVDGDRGADRE